MAKTSPSAVLPPARPECTCAALRRATRLITQVYDDELAPAGLRITQYSLLATLDRHGALAMTDLAAQMALDRTTLTRNLAPLERDGLLTTRATGSGRTKRVALTALGRRRLLAAFPAWERAQSRVRAAVGDVAVPDLSDLVRSSSP